jgi:hypothetical protein
VRRAISDKAQHKQHNGGECGLQEGVARPIPNNGLIPRILEPSFFLSFITYVEPRRPRKSITMMSDVSKTQDTAREREIKDQTSPVRITISPTTINHEHHHHERCRRW